jgi:hypothetical protein
MRVERFTALEIPKAGEPTKQQSNAVAAAHPAPGK